MPEGDIETFHQDGKWHNKVEGASVAFVDSHSTKAEAVRIGREMAREARVEHIIKNKDGRIAERNTYGHDPRDIKG